MLILKDKNFTECLVLFSYVLILKHKGEQHLITQEWLFQLLQETNSCFRLSVETDYFLILFKLFCQSQI